MEKRKKEVTHIYDDDCGLLCPTFFVVYENALLSKLSAMMMMMAHKRTDGRGKGGGAPRWSSHHVSQPSFSFAHGGSGGASRIEEQSGSNGKSKHV